MNIYYDGLDFVDNMVTFTEVPNILKLQENVEGTKAFFQFFIGSNIKQTVTGDGQYYITLFGETITNVMSPTDANNKRFYISDNNVSTAMSIAKAFRDCASINADYNVYVNTDSNAVVLHARAIGKKLIMSDYLDINIPNVGTSFSNDGTPDPTSPTLTSLFQSKIDVDVYTGTSVTGSNYVTTLEKNFYDNECSFNMSPVLSTMSEYGKSVPYCFNIQAVLANGEYSHIDTITGHSIVGYTANQSDKYLYLGSTQLLLNRYRGGYGNPITFYIYGNKLNYSVLLDEGASSWNLHVILYDSSNSVIVQYEDTRSKSGDSGIMADDEFVINPTYLSNAFYVELRVDNDALRFEVIKPIKAAESYQRIAWRNCFGGLQFYDFTGSISETNSIDATTYQKSVFDYYENDAFQLNKVYSNKTVKTVKLKSHIMRKEGTYIFDDLMKSKCAWTIINDKKKYIIVKNIDVQEDSTYDGLYTVTVDYEYSYE